MKNLNQKVEDQDQDRKESVKSSGKTVEDAIQKGLEQLNLTKDQVEIEIVKQGSRGILGLGAEDAVILLTPKPRSDEVETSLTNDELPSTDEVFVEAQTTAPDSEVAPISESTSTDRPDTDFSPEVKERAKEILQNLLDKMSVTAEVSVRIGDDLVEEGEASPLTLDIVGSDLGLLIGRRGETLRALQFVTRQILSKEFGRWVPVVVDVESYLVRRRKTLQQLAKRMADRVVFSRRKVVLEPMPPQERRIIHLELRTHEHVYTNSTGEGESRKVVILPK
jgi:spoIIIJ-associated protein